MAGRCVYETIFDKLRSGKTDVAAKQSCFFGTRLSRGHNRRGGLVSMESPAFQRFCGLSVRYCMNGALPRFSLRAWKVTGEAQPPDRLKCYEHWASRKWRQRLLIRATIKVVELGQLPDGTSVFQNRLAYESDGIMVINRLETHTSMWKAVCAK
jgi:hypothetical protein